MDSPPAGGSPSGEGETANRKKRQKQVDGKNCDDEMEMVEETQAVGGKTSMGFDRDGMPAMSFRDKLMKEIEKREEMDKKWKELEALEWTTDMLQVGSREKWPSIYISDQAREKLRRPWMDCLIVKLLGRSIGYKLLLDRTKKMWNPYGDFDLIDLGEGYFLAKFSEFRDYQYALEEGPWNIMGHYLTVRKWQPDFRPEQDRINRTAVWVRLPGFPLEYYNEHILMAVGNTLGRALKVDANTKCSMRGRFARICIEIDLDKPLVPKIDFNGAWQNIEYEGLPLICFECGRTGHKTDLCPQGITMQRVVNAGNVTFQSKDAGGSTEETGEGAFGPWMVAQKRQPRRRQESRSRSANNQGGDNGSRFSVLEVEDGEIVGEDLAGDFSKVNYVEVGANRNKDFVKTNKKVGPKAQYADKRVGASLGSGKENSHPEAGPSFGPRKSQQSHVVIKSPVLNNLVNKQDRIEFPNQKLISRSDMEIGTSYERVGIDEMVEEEAHPIDPGDQPSNSEGDQPSNSEGFIGMEEDERVVVQARKLSVPSSELLGIKSTDLRNQLSKQVLQVKNTPPGGVANQALHQ